MSFVNKKLQDRHSVWWIVALILTWGICQVLFEVKQLKIWCSKCLRVHNLLMISSNHKNTDDLLFRSWTFRRGWNPKHCPNTHKLHERESIAVFCSLRVLELWYHSGFTWDTAAHFFVDKIKRRQWDEGTKYITSIHYRLGDIKKLITKFWFVLWNCMNDLS